MSTAKTPDLAAKPTLARYATPVNPAQEHSIVNCDILLTLRFYSASDICGRHQPCTNGRYVGAINKLAILLVQLIDSNVHVFLWSLNTEQSIVRFQRKYTGPFSVFSVFRTPLQKAHASIMVVASQLYI